PPAVPGRDGSLSVSASLEPRATGARPPREADAAELCEGLSQAQQERCERCGCDLRGSGAAIDAVCSNQDERAAGWLDAAPNPAFRLVRHRPDPEQRPQHMESEQADPACRVDSVCVRMMARFGDLRGNVMDRDDAVKDHNGNKDKQSEGEVVREWIANHFPLPFGFHKFRNLP